MALFGAVKFFLTCKVIGHWNSLGILQSISDSKNEKRGNQNQDL